METERVEVIVVGSGYGGSIIAARLAEAGRQVLVLERGPRLSSADFQHSDDPRYIQKIVDVVVASDRVAFRTGNMVGGASIPMDGAHFRAPQKTFDAVDHAGKPYWPEGYSRAAMDPYYARVEAELAIRQWSWDEISRAGGLFAKMLADAGASCDRARMNYGACLHCGYCAQGCKWDKKNTMLHTYLPRAEAAGAEVRPGCKVARVEVSGPDYVVHYTQDGEAKSAVAPLAVIAAGGIHTPALLLRSRSGLPGLSARVGHGFNNNGEHAFLGILPPETDPEYLCYKGADNAGVMSFHWFAEEGFTLHPGGGFEPSLFAAALAAADHPVLPKRAWGLEYKRFVESVYPHRVIGFSALGLADGHRRVTVNGMGQPDLVNEDRASHDAYLDRLESIVFDVGAKTGITLIPAVPRHLAGMTSAHLLSACRMADSPDDGVVDGDGQCFGLPNLYLCDASVVPYALGVNPALTISAIAERTADRILGVA